MSVEVRVAIRMSLLSVEAAFISMRLNSDTNFFTWVANSGLCCISSDKRASCRLSSKRVRWREKIPLCPELYLVQSSWVASGVRICEMSMDIE